MAPFSLLLIDGDAPPLAEALERTVPGLQVTPCTSLVAARAHLVGSEFGAVLAAYDLPDGQALSLLDLEVVVPPLWVRAGTSLRAEEATKAGALGFVSGRDLQVLAPFVAWHGAHVHRGEETTEESLADTPAPEAGDAASEALETVLRPLRSEMSRIAHAINNPLAVISGNVQLVRELIASVPDDPMVVSSLDDIATASRELTDLINEISDLRRTLGTDGSPED